ncbi:hypothetical protein [uncultured Methylobacterium sp.]|jgi:hypothetical protein|uniref:hypothetical protein n=1 Tax=uncultured Methylobacterium sp. TaxID=157278 RepID=UPI00262F7AF4|nr:hypothetical protein [uncultured Methylobacterium sp.]
MALARFAIERAASPAVLRQWWRGETVRRVQCGLSPTQEQELAQACRLQVERLQPAAAA